MKTYYTNIIFISDSKSEKKPAEIWFYCNWLRLNSNEPKWSIIEKNKVWEPIKEQFLLINI